MSENKTLNLASAYVRLRGDATVETLPVDDSFWSRLMSGELGTFHNDYLVSCHTFETDWPMWEMHPNGDEIVCLLSGMATFILDMPQATNPLPLRRQVATPSFLKVSGTRRKHRLERRCCLSRPGKVLSTEKYQDEADA